MSAGIVDYGFDGCGYLNSVATAGRSVTPALATGSLQWTTLTFKNNTTTLMTGSAPVPCASATAAGRRSLECGSC